jgi:hypothetical protein
MAGFGNAPFGTSPFGIGGTGTAPLVATVQLDATPPRVRLDVTSSATSVTIYRVATDGTKTVVRTSDGGPLSVSGGSAFLYDPEPPYGKQVYYVTDSGARSETVVVDVDDIWLTHPAVPSRSCKVRVAEISDRQAAANQSTRYPLGRKYPIVASDGKRKAATYTLTLKTETADELAALERLLDDLSPLLLNIPAGMGWIGTGTEYVACGDLALANPTEYAGDGYREWSLPCSVVDRPAGGSQAFVTYDYLYALYPTYNDWKATGKTYNQLFDPD